MVSHPFRSILNRAGDCRLGERWEVGALVHVLAVNEAVTVRAVGVHVVGNWLGRDRPVNVSAPRLTALSSAHDQCAMFCFAFLFVVSHFFCRIIPFLIGERHLRGRPGKRNGGGGYARFGDAGGGSVLGGVCATDVCAADIRTSVLQ